MPACKEPKLSEKAMREWLSGLCEVMDTRSQIIHAIGDAQEKAFASGDKRMLATSADIAKAASLHRRTTMNKLMEMFRDGDIGRVRVGTEYHYWNVK